MVIAHNISSINANTYLNNIGKYKANTTNKLSSGYRINIAADDAAGLTISEKMRWQIRGLNKASNNIQDGVSLLQVADGALGEVNDILNRMRELSVQAANDTNTTSDRAAIQNEINELINELNRIGDTTEFNTQKLFTGGEEEILGPNGSPISIDNIPFSDFQMADVSLTDGPISGISGFMLELNAKLNDGYKGVQNTSWNLIFGNGSTSHSGIRVTYENQGTPVEYTADLNIRTTSSYSYDSSTKTGSRVFSIDAGNGATFDITQKISLGANDGNSQYYSISYEVANTGSKDAKIDFLFNADTAYNNNDICESYYIGNGNRIDNFSLYTDSSVTGTEYTSQSPDMVKPLSSLNLSDGISIIDVEHALPFSVNIIPDNIDTLSIGNYYNHTGNWNYYSNLGQYLGGNTHQRDIALSFIWSNKDINPGDAQTFSLKYGIKSAKNDTNIPADIVYQKGSKIKTDTKKLWIQSGALDKSGLFIEIGEMNSSVLGISSISVDTYEHASTTIEKIDQAIEKINTQRSKIGAQQNRLTHAMNVDNNTSENTQAAESRIRDTDIADEMVNYSKYNILEQSGISVLSQSNHSMETILSLLQ